MTTTMRARGLAALLLLTPLVAAQYGGGGTSSTNSLSSRGSAVNDRLVLSDIQLTELKGVWLNTGRQQPMSAVMALENNTLPDCSMDDTGLSSYTGLDTGAGQFYVLAGTGGVNAMNVNLQRSTFAPNVTYNSSIIVAIRNNQPSCTHFAPYVDLSTGELKAESISITQWTVNATSGNPARSNLNCEVTGNEMAGCYSGSVATAPATATTPTVSVSSIGAPAPRPAGAIRTVTRNTYTCQNGECLRLNPKFSTTSPAYGG